MVIQVTGTPGRTTRAVATPPPEPVATFQQRVAETIERFRSGAVTPGRFLDLEKTLQVVAADACRALLEQEANRVEGDRPAMPAKIRYQRATYRINKKTPARIATSFGTITLQSFYYLNDCDGEPGLHPLFVRLGIGAGAATPALLERLARLAVDHTQQEVRAWLAHAHGIRWSNTRLRAALAGFRRALLPYVADLHKLRLLQWLEQAQASRGRHRPVLAVGRDGVMIPMRAGGYQEASTATVSVYDRRRRRLGTIYLGQMPQAKQVTLSAELTALLRAVLLAWQGPLPRLAYITDKGAAPDEYYRRVLKKLKHPRDGQALRWEWVLDFYHVGGYIGKVADALFGAETARAAQWFAKMRRWLRERAHGVAQVLRSAMQHLGRRRMSKVQRAEFWKAYRYLRRHRRLLDYQGYRRRGLPIGSGVTEAACKTVFTQRFKRSGMRWHRASGQVIVDLRLMYLCGIWDAAFTADLAARSLPQPYGTSQTTTKNRSHHPTRRGSHEIAA